ncbi:MAG TPA: PepSY domain-containing protein [Planctomycetota bacterium]|nr:PepSY domain-containing protein [Planctomycetota bacterium]
MDAPSRFDDLLRRWSDAEATVEELAELESLLRADARYRHALVRMVRLDVDLYARYARSVPAARTSPGRNLARAAAVLAVGVSLMAAAWLLLRAPTAPSAWRVASGVLRVAGAAAGTLDPGQAFDTGPSPVRMLMGKGTLELDPSTAGRREAVDALRLDRGGVRVTDAGPLRVETPIGTLLSSGGRFEIRLVEVPVSVDVRLAEGDAEARYGGQVLRLRPGRTLRLGGPRTLARTKKPDEFLREASFDLATAVDRVAAEVRGIPVEAGLEDEKGRAAFSVELADGAKLRERTIDAATGKVLEEDTEDDDRSALVGRMRVPLAAAIRTGLEAVPGKALQAACDLRDGAPRARIEILAAEGVFEVVVDLEQGHAVSIAK